MTRIILILTILFLPASIPAHAQKPKVVRTYFSKGGDWCNNKITLANNGIFFYTGSCKKEMAVSKGDWKISGDKLYLHGWDSVRCYPKAKVDFIKGGTTDTISITAFDYFGKPFHGLALEFVGFNNSIQFEQADSLGRFYVSRKDCKGFVLYFQGEVETNYYTFEKGTRDVKIFIDFASSAALDRKAVAIYFGNPAFIIKKDGLYSSDGVLRYEKLNPNSRIPKRP